MIEIQVLRNGIISSMSGRSASSRLLFASPASQANVSGTMPAAKVEVNIGSSIIKNNFKKFRHTWLRSTHKCLILVYFRVLSLRHSGVWMTTSSPPPPPPPPKKSTQRLILLMQHQKIKNPHCRELYPTH